MYALSRFWQTQVDLELAALGTSVRDLGEWGDVILFGSRSIGVETVKSDWDLLCVGRGITRKTPVLDLVCVSPERVATLGWLGSELAHHVGRFGVALAGSFAWRTATFCGHESVLRKSSRIGRRAELLEARWSLLSAVHQRKHLSLLRRDVQRLRYLSKGLAVPPSPILDCEFTGDLSCALSELTALGLLHRSVAAFLDRPLECRKNDKHAARLGAENGPPR